MIEMGCRCSRCCGCAKRASQDPNGRVLKPSAPDLKKAELMDSSTAGEANRKRDAEEAAAAAEGCKTPDNKAKRPKWAPQTLHDFLHTHGQGLSNLQHLEEQLRNNGVHELHTLVRLAETPSQLESLCKNFCKIDEGETQLLKNLLATDAARDQKRGDLADWLGRHGLLHLEGQLQKASNQAERDVNECTHLSMHDGYVGACRCPSPTVVRASLLWMTRGSCRPCCGLSRGRIGMRA